MINKSAIGFAAVLLIVGTGMDYYQQTLKTGVALGDLSATGYIDTIKDRFDGANHDRAKDRALAALKERQKEGARVYLPKAPEGWERRAWSDGDNSRISGAPRENTEMEQELLAASPMLKAMLAADEINSEKRLNAQTWVYQRGTEIVSVRAWFAPEIKGNSVSSSAMKIIAGNLSGMAGTEGWGIIQGVAFGQTGSFDPENAKDYQRLSATIGFGDEVHLEVRSAAPEAATREILNAIDFDGLNALLPRPLGHVGHNAPEIEIARQKEMADKMIAIRTDLIRRRGRAAEQALTEGTASETAMSLALGEIGFGNDETSAADAKATDELAASEQAVLSSDSPAKGAGSGGIWGMVTGFLGGDADQAVVDDPAQAPETPAVEEPAPVRRLKIGDNSISSCTKGSKGKSCVVGEN